MKNLVKSLLLSLSLFGLTALLFITVSGTHPTKARAAPTGSFNPGRIIDNGIFFNSNSLTTSEIQAFLNSKVPVCDTNGTQPYAGTTRGAYGTSRGYPPPYTCLKNFSQAIPSVSADAYCGGGLTAATLSAAQIITAVSSACSINPQVLLVLLQKEQGLVTDDWPWSIQYRSATGYGCPDTAACDANYYGFFNQVYNAAHQFQRYGKQSQLFNYRANGTFFVPYNPSSSCGGSNVFIQNSATAALYNYTPYQPNAAALAAGYGSAPPCGAYGNRNFWLYFNDWFGSPYMPMAFKSTSSSTVYMYVSGFKVAVPNMATLQDYGISPQSIQTLSQGAIDTIPTPGPSDGISSSLNYLVKSPSDSDADGGAVYLISIGRKNAVISMQQFNDFGFDVANIAYLPLGFINSLPGNQPLSYYLQTPSSLVFQISGGAKRPIFDPGTFASYDPSGAVSPVSYYIPDTFPSGDPLSTKDTLLQQQGSSAVYLFTSSGNYYLIPTAAIYECTGASFYLNLPFIQLDNNSYIAPISPRDSLSCLVNDGQGSTYILNKNSKYNIPLSYGSFTSQTLNTDAFNVINRLPTLNLKRAVKSSQSATIWFVDSGAKRPIPSLSNYTLLGLNGFDTVDDTTLSAIPTGGIKLGDGKVVKTDDSPAVYVTEGNARLLFSTSDDFIAYQNAWSDIETYPAATLNADYPYSGLTVGKYLLDTSNNKTFLVDANGCYLLNSSQLTSYGNPATQSYNYARFNEGSCVSGSLYVKQKGTAPVYLIQNGQKRLFTTWDSLVANSGTNNPYILELSQSTMNSFPAGANMN